MLEQILQRADFYTEEGEVTCRFGPVVNDSQQKNLLNELQQKTEEEWGEIKSAGNPDKLNKAEIYERLYNGEFASLKDMNLNGWKLEGFTSVLDVSQIRIQVAIFSRNILV